MRRSSLCRMVDSALALIETRGDTTPAPDPHTHTHSHTHSFAQWISDSAVALPNQLSHLQSLAIASPCFASAPRLSLSSARSDRDTIRHCACTRMLRVHVTLP